MSRLAIPGLLKRQVTGSLGNSPATMAMAAADLPNEGILGKKLDAALPELAA